MPTHVRALTWGSWALDAAIRAVQIGALAAVSAIGTEALLREIDWLVVVEIAVLAVVVSLLTSLADVPASTAHRTPDASLLPGSKENGDDG